MTSSNLTVEDEKTWKFLKIVVNNNSYLVSEYNLY